APAPRGGGAPPRSARAGGRARAVRAAWPRAAPSVEEVLRQAGEEPVHPRAGVQPGPRQPLGTVALTGLFLWGYHPCRPAASTDPPGSTPGRPGPDCWSDRMTEAGRYW